MTRNWAKSVVKSWSVHGTPAGPPSTDRLTRSVHVGPDLVEVWLDLRHRRTCRRSGNDVPIALLRSVIRNLDTAVDAIVVDIQEDVTLVSRVPERRGGRPGREAGRRVRGDGIRRRIIVRFLFELSVCGCDAPGRRVSAPCSPGSVRSRARCAERSARGECRRGTSPGSDTMLTSLRIALDQPRPASLTRQYCWGWMRNTVTALAIPRPPGVPMGEADVAASRGCRVRRPRHRPPARAGASLPRRRRTPPAPGWPGGCCRTSGSRERSTSATRPAHKVAGDVESSD